MPPQNFITTVDTAVWSLFGMQRYLETCETFPADGPDILNIPMKQESTRVLHRLR